MNQYENSARGWATNASRKMIAAIAGTTAMLLVLAAGILVLTSRTDVIVEANGVSKPVTVWSGTVSNALAAAGIEPGEHDLVVPDLSAAVSEGQVITFTSAKPYTVKESDGTREVWSTADSLEEVMDIISESGRDVALAANRSVERAALPAVLGAAGSVKVAVDGKAKNVDVPAGATIPQILKLAEVTPSPIDQVYLESGEEGPVVNVIRQTRGTVTQTKEIDFKTVERDSDELYEGETRVVQKGKKGTIKTTKYEQKRGKDVLVSTVLKEERTEPVDKIVERGTKEKPKNDQPQASEAPRPGRGTGSAPAGVWAALAQCESGGNPATNTGNGFYGLYQFSLPTWQAMGGTGLPSDASAAEQTMRAQMLQQRAGWGQWPACSASLGLR